MGVVIIVQPVQNHCFWLYFHMLHLCISVILPPFRHKPPGNTNERKIATVGFRIGWRTVF
jgi:hypothetical protein